VPVAAGERSLRARFLRDLDLQGLERLHDGADLLARQRRQVVPGFRVAELRGFRARGRIVAARAGERGEAEEGEETGQGEEGVHGTRNILRPSESVTRRS